MIDRVVELFSVFGVFKEEFCGLFFIGFIILGTYIICKIVDAIEERYEQWKWKNGK